VQPDVELTVADAIARLRAVGRERSIHDLVPAVESLLVAASIRLPAAQSTERAAVLGIILATRTWLGPDDRRRVGLEDVGRACRRYEEWAVAAALRGRFEGGANVNERIGLTPIAPRPAARVS
jgi:hypothetical protein